MSIPSITIRFDFPDASSARAAGTGSIPASSETAAGPGPAPVNMPGLGAQVSPRADDPGPAPVDLPGLESAHQGSAEGAAPSPTLTPHSAGIAATAPSPSAETLGTDLATTFDVPPEPELDIPGLNPEALGDDGDAGPKRPTGGETGTKKPTRSRSRK